MLPKKSYENHEKPASCQGCDGVCCKKLQAATSGLRAYQTDQMAAPKHKSGKEAKCADK